MSEAEIENDGEQKPDKRKKDSKFIRACRTAAMYARRASVALGAVLSMHEALNSSKE